MGNYPDGQLSGFDCIIFAICDHGIVLFPLPPAHIVEDMLRVLDVGSSKRERERERERER
jgi:hypothetical protein